MSCLVTTRAAGGSDQNTDGDGYGISVEVGKSFQIRNGLSLIPQAQLIYSGIDMDNLVDPTGGGVTSSLADGDTLTARLGMRAEYELASQSLVYGQFDYFHALDNRTGVEFGQNTILTERSKNSLGLTLGGQIAYTDRTTFYGEVSGTSGVGSSSDDYSFAGTLGVELRF